MASTIDETLDRAIKLDIPNEEYYLTTWSAGDIHDVLEIMSVDAVNNNLLIVPKPYTLDDAIFWTNRMITAKTTLLAAGCTTQARNERLFAQDTSVPMQAIRHGGPAGNFVGCTSLSPRLGQGVVMLGYYLHPAHQGKGLMAVASIAAIKWAREVFGVRRIFSSADHMNPASGRTIEKVSAATAVGEIEKGTKMIRWEDSKVVEGREKESLSRTWEWSV